MVLLFVLFVTTAKVSGMLTSLHTTIVRIRSVWCGCGSVQRVSRGRGLQRRLEWMMVSVSDPVKTGTGPVLETKRYSMDQGTSFAVTLPKTE